LAEILESSRRGDWAMLSFPFGTLFKIDKALLDDILHRYSLKLPTK
jgi:hypothetical protein